MIDDMASAGDAGMPPIRLRDAKFNENSKDFTWSTRQNINIRRLSAALRAVGIKAESDTSFGDSIMVVITPPGTDRQIKGQVLADGTIRLAGCRDDGELAAHAVATSLNNSGALQGGPVDPAAVQCEVWLTKRSFQVCSEQQTINMDKLYAFLNDQRQRQSQHAVLSLWVRDKGDNQFIKSINKVGTACPRLEVKFAPIVIDEWEQVRRCKPEPVSISIHNKGEVQLAGNAEYKVLQAVYFLNDIISRHGELLMDADEQGAAQPSRTPKRKLEVATNPEGSDTLLTPTPVGAKKQRSKTAAQTPVTAVRGAKKNAANVSSPSASQNCLPTSATSRGADDEEVSSADSAEQYHQNQLVALAMLRMCSEGALYWANAQAAAMAKDAETSADDAKAHRPAALDMGRTRASPPPSSKPKLAALTISSSFSDELALAELKNISAFPEAESPPVSPTGLSSSDAGFQDGRSTPVSPAKVVTKVRRRSKSNSQQVESAKAVCGLPALPHMMMALPSHAMPQAPWMPHAWAPHPHPVHTSPWTTLAKAAHIIPSMPQ